MSFLALCWKGRSVQVDLTLPRGVWIQISWKDQQLLGERFQRFQTQDGFFRQSGQWSWLHQLVAPAGCIKVGPSHSHGQCPWKRDNFWENRKTTRILLTGDCIPYPKLHSWSVSGKLVARWWLNWYHMRSVIWWTQLLTYLYPLPTPKNESTTGSFYCFLLFIRDLGYNK